MVNFFIDHFILAMNITIIFQLIFLNIALSTSPSSSIDQSLIFEFMGEKVVNKGDCAMTGCIRVEADKLFIRGNQSGNRYIELYIDQPHGVGEYKISSGNRIELSRGRSHENKVFRSGYFSCQGCDASYSQGSIIITRFDGPGGFIAGRFKTSISEIGVWKEQLPIEGTFKVYREK